MLRTVVSVVFVGVSSTWWYGGGGPAAAIVFPFAAAEAYLAAAVAHGRGLRYP